MAGGEGSQPLRQGLMNEGERLSKSHIWEKNSDCQGRMKTCEAALRGGVHDRSGFRLLDSLDDATPWLP